ncbi:hypothetical protein ACPUEK_06425 [Marinomonas gallaica]|uniref:hypothetical protein n=1 Tax=Marinomonas gallaica TaxID=1806667 RepID=UPI003CE4BB06
MADKLTASDLIELIPTFRQAVAEENLDAILYINDILTDVIKTDGISLEYLENHSSEFEELYELIRKSEDMIESLKKDVKEIQTELVKKRKISKKYSDVGKL